MSSILAESRNFLVIGEYEKVFLHFKNSNRKICIGDFYGDPQAAVISTDESFCVMVGYGLIIYYLQEPFIEYSYHLSTEQWKELFRESSNEWWIEHVDVINNSTILFTAEEVDLKTGGRYRLNPDSMEVLKYN